MDTTTATGATSTPASTPAATSAPASTPTSTPVTPSAPVTTEDQGSGSTAAQVDNRSTQEIARDTLLERLHLNPDGTDKVDSAADPNELPGDNGDVVVPPAGEEESQQQAADKGSGNGEDGAEAYSFDDYALEEFSPVGPQALNQKLSANPEVAAALEKDPEFRDQLFANARRAERAAKYDEIVGSPDEAQVAMSNSSTFVTLGEHLEGIQEGNYDSLTPFLEGLKELTAYRDENGEILRNADGSMRTNGLVGRFVKTMVSERLAITEMQARAEGNDELLAALDVVKAGMGLRAPASADEDYASDELKAERDAIAQERKLLNDQKEAQFKADLEASDNRVASKTDAALDFSIKQILERASGLDDFSRSKVETDLRKGLMKVIRSSTSYRNQRNVIERMPLGPKREAEVVKLNTRFINENLAKVARGIMAEAGVSLKGKADARASRQAARVQQSQSETHTSMAPVKTAGAPAGETLDQIEARMTQERGGRKPSMQEVIAEQMAQRMGIRKTA